jgi:hypothetical protein
MFHANSRQFKFEEQQRTYFKFMYAPELKVLNVVDTNVGPDMVSRIRHARPWLQVCFGV